MEKIKYYSPSDFPSYLANLNDLYDDLFSDGKGFRAHLVHMISDKVGLKKEKIKLLCQSIEFIHNASLLHDDVVDQSPLRRNKTAAWMKYGTEYAVLAGDYLFTRVMVNLSHYGNMDLVRLTANTINDLLEGEWIQDTFKGKWLIDSDQIDQVHILKTGCLFKWCVKAPFLYKGGVEEKQLLLLDDLGRLMGLLFQRSDDLLDFDVRNYENKAKLSDLKAGFLNSFSSFLLKGRSEDFKKKFFNSQSLEDIYKLVPKSEFDEFLKKFDDQNEKLINSFEESVGQLKSYLSGEEEKLVDELLTAVKMVYWRKK